MPVMGRKPKAKSADAAGGKPRRNVIFITLDGPTEDAVTRFINSQRVKPDRAAVGLTALLEFLDKVGFSPEYPGPKPPPAPG